MSGRRLSLCAIVAPALLLPACHDKPHRSIDRDTDEVRVDIPTRDGRAKMRTGPQVMPHLPLGFTLAPGARVLHATDVERGDKHGSLVDLASPDSPAALAQFYRRQAEASGIAISYALAGKDRQTLVGQGPRGRSFTLSARREGGRTRAELFVSDGLRP